METPVATASALPRAAQVRLQALENAARVGDDGGTPPTVTPPADSTPPTPTPAPTPTGETVTVSREEFNALQAKAGKTAQAEAQTSLERERALDLAHRLTELEKAGKATPTPAPTPAPPLVEAVDITAEERQGFEESEDFIAKVANNVVAKAFASLSGRLADIEARLGGAQAKADEAIGTVARANARTFLSQLKEKVPSLDGIIAHKNWGDYLDETEELTGATMGQLLTHNIQKENLTAAVKIYRAFATKYMEGAGGGDAAAGYAGGGPSGAASDAVTNAPKQEKLKHSMRVKASKDYRMGRITWDDLQLVNKKFEEAEKNGNVDYDN